MPPPTADLSGWARGPFSACGYTQDVYQKGQGPGVVLMPEIPESTRQCLDSVTTW